MRGRSLFIYALAALSSGFWAAGAIWGADPNPVPAGDTAALARRIDRRLAQRWKAEGVAPALRTSDAEFLRRSYLDLTGRLPSVSEVRQFLAEADDPAAAAGSAPAADKRSRLVARLLASPSHATHLANTWRQFLLPDDIGLQQLALRPPFESWLREKFADNVPYDAMVSELLVAKGQVQQSGPMLFYTALQLKPEELAASTSRAFLGVQIQCAQCHGHPFDVWSMKDFWGFAAFFARLQRPGNAEQQFFAQVADSDAGEVRLPTTDEVVSPKFLGGAEATDEAGANRRQQLARWMTSGDNPYFARATVNRAWWMLFGRGLIEPVDDLGQHNQASHPELLDELADYFVRSGFDLRGLLEALATTEAYQLSSETTSGDSAPPELFSRMAIKTMSAEQFYDSLADATLRRQSAGGGFAALRGPFDQNRQAFLNKFQTQGSPLEYQAGILQALTLMNGAVTSGATDLENSDILGSLAAPFFSDEQRIETLFLATLSRSPSAEERSKCLEYVKSRSPELRPRALSDVLWALLNSAEFALNH